MWTSPNLTGDVVKQRHFEAIFPEACVEARVMMYTPEVEADVLAGSPDFVLDAIDNIDTKVTSSVHPLCV